MEFRTMYNRDLRAASDAAAGRLPQVPVEMVETAQEFGDETDVNTVVRRFGHTGQLPVARQLAEYGDFSEAPADFGQAMLQVKRGEEAFASLPASLREKFGNDPISFWRWIQEEDNVDEAIRLGILKDRRSVASEPSRALDATSGTPQAGSAITGDSSASAGGAG